jgi:hypothetical protein
VKVSSALKVALCFAIGWPCLAHAQTWQALNHPAPFSTVDCLLLSSA